MAPSGILNLRSNLPSFTEVKLSAQDGWFYLFTFLGEFSFTKIECSSLGPVIDSMALNSMALTYGLFKATVFAYANERQASNCLKGASQQISLYL